MNILNELLDSSDKMREVSKDEYSEEAFTYAFDDDVYQVKDGISIVFSLPSKDGVKNYLFVMYYTGKIKYTNYEIHFSIKNNEGKYVPDLSNLGNAPLVFGAIAKFVMVGIKKFNPDVLHIICKDSDESRKRVYRILSKRIPGYTPFQETKKFFGPLDADANFISVVRNDIYPLLTKTIKESNMPMSTADVCGAPDPHKVEWKYTKRFGKKNKKNDEKTKDTIIRRVMNKVVKEEKYEIQ